MELNYLSPSLFVIGVVLGLISISLLIIIYNYINSKPPGMQTQLDLLVVDNIRAWTLHTVLSSVVLSIGVFHGKIEVFVAHVIVGIFSFVDHMVIAAFTVTLIVKWILVFKSDWFDEVSDEKVLNVSRISMVIYSTFLQLINSVWLVVNDIKLPMIRHMSGEENHTPFGPGCGTLIGVLLLIIILVLFEVKRPAEENEMRFKSATYTGFMAAIGILMITFVANFELISNENIPLVFPCMLQILIGIVQPYLYIMGKENLKTYALNILVEPLRKFNSLKTLSNQILPI